MTVNYRQPYLCLCRGTFVLVEGALLLRDDPGGDIAAAGERVELDPVDGGGHERPRTVAHRHLRRGRQSPSTPRSSSLSALVASSWGRRLRMAYTRWQNWRTDVDTYNRDLKGSRD